MIKHEFNKIVNWVGLYNLKNINLKYFVTLTIKDSLLREGKDTGYFTNLYDICNDRGEYVKFKNSDNNFINIESCYLNKNKDEEGDRFKYSSIFVKKENIYFSYECLVKLLKRLKLKYNHINYGWSFEVSNMFHFHILLSDVADLTELRSFLRKEWNNILNAYNIPSTECDYIIDFNASLNYMFKLPLKMGFDKSIHFKIEEYRNIYEYKLGLEFFDLILKSKIVYEKVSFLETVFELQVKDVSINEQKRLEISFLERSLRYQKDTKHFFNYFGRLLKTRIYPDFYSYIVKLRNDLIKKNDVISFFIVSRLFKDKELNFMNVRFAYKFLISIFTLFYVHSKRSIKRNKLSFYSQIGKIFYYGQAKIIHDEIFEKLKVLYPGFNSQQTYELLYKNTGMYFMTFFSLYEFINIKEFSDNMILINYFDNEEIEEYKITKRKLYGQNFPMCVKPKDWNLAEKHLNKNFTGGLLNNGIDFNIPLGKGNNRILKSNSGRIIDEINYLQSVSYEIDCMVLEYLNKNKKVIKEMNILLNIDENLDLDFVKIQKEKSYNTKLDVFDKVIHILNEFKIQKCFYFLYQIDFRGRIYVMSDYLNYQTNKIVRSIIRYNNKQLLMKNSEVIDWLKIATVRKFLGSKKESYSWFVDYFNNSLESLIKDWIFCRSSENEYFWMKADEPYQFLSLLFEWFRFYISDNSYISGYIVFFDATCSGSQIISLLLGCDKYVNSLNLNASIKDDKIQDYYLFVVKEFLVFCEKNHLKKHFYCNLLKTYDDAILRKFFKRIIMTINYGLTKKGMKFKFKEQLIEVNKVEEWTDHNLKVFIDAFYEFLENLFLVKSLNILIRYIEFLIKNNKDFIVYTTFDGFVFDNSSSDLLIGLNYNKKESYKYNYSLSKNYKRKKKQMQLVFYNKLRDNKKEVRAFKANYIHHIDAIIVYSLLNRLNHHKIDISVIHDCFGIKLNDIVLFNKEYRDVLVKLFNKENNFLDWLKYLFNKDISDVELLNALLKELELLRNSSDGLVVNDVNHSLYIVFP